MTHSSTCQVLSVRQLIMAVTLRISLPEHVPTDRIGAVTFVMETLVLKISITCGDTGHLHYYSHGCLRLTMLRHDLGAKTRQEQ